MAFGWTTYSIAPTIGASLLRIGLMLGIVSLALPNLARIGKWFSASTVVAILIGAGLIAARPSLAMYVAFTLVAFMVLRSFATGAGKTAAPKKDLANRGPKP